MSERTFNIFMSMSILYLILLAFNTTLIDIIRNNNQIKELVYQEEDIKDKIKIKELVYQEEDIKDKIIREYNLAKNELESLATSISSIYKIDYDESFNIVVYTYKYALDNNIKPTLALGLIAAESSFKRNARSNYGAIGYTQVVPRWHRDKIKDRDIYDMEINIEVGMAVLRDCFNRFGNQEKALACYNGATERDQVVRYTTKINKRKKEILKLASI